MSRIILIFWLILLPVYTLASEPETIFYTTNGSQPTTGFTIFQREQVLPKYLTVTDTTGTLEYLNPGKTPNYPSTFGVKLCYSTPFSIYSAAASERQEVWQDFAGVATVVQILAVCPQFTP